ncbi:uncharacterized protein [Rutidosis leptorrhynchoides]|uniref:uncharacterized protein n=1 Tax=Rutidosis leptorrhynchoides TaxID=125765 RepID=UPI003A99F0F3
MTWNWASNPRWRAAAELSNLEKDMLDLNQFSNKPDTWTWKHEKCGKYTSSSLSNLLVNAFVANKPLPEPTVINALILQKIGIFMWRMHKNKLPVRIELDNKGIDLHSVLCPVCDDCVECIQHAMISCKSAASVWDKLRRWWNLDKLPFEVYSDLIDCSMSHINSKTGTQIWQAVVWITAYFIWKNRNAKVFGNNASSIPKLLSDIQSKSFEWINDRGSNIDLDWHSWVNNPSACALNFKPKDGIG